jgi:hypothetical protein
LVFSLVLVYLNLSIMPEAAKRINPRVPILLVG